MKILEKSIIIDGYRIDYSINKHGDSYIIYAGGGEEHIGSVVLAVPRNSLADSDTIGCAVSVLNVPGHKEEEIARLLAEALCLCSKMPSVAVSGIHFDNIDRQGIETIININHHAVEKIGEWLVELI